MEEDTQYIFVYGTLRDSSVNHKAHYLKQNARSIGAAKINAKLYKVSWYPAVVITSNEIENVHGEIFEIADVNKEVVLHELDGYEGIYDANDESEEYERVIATAKTTDGKAYRCWVYNYKSSVEKAEQIVSGDYIKYLETNRN